MKKIFNYSFITILLLYATACDNGFDELNTSKIAPNGLDPALILNGAIVNTSYGAGFAGGGTLIYDMSIVQHIISPLTGVINGANFNVVNRDATGSMWQNYYRNVIRYTRDVIAQTKDLPERSNLMNEARILQAYAFMVLTDEYGDIPYFQAGKGYLEGENFPDYDPQEDIYTDIIRELTEASAALDPAGRVESSEVLYSGSVEKWKKFGYSLLLRAGMRLSKVNASKAQETVAAAFQGGIMTSNDDNASIKHQTNFLNGTGNTLNTTEAANFYLSQYFVDHLKNNNDPRLPEIAVRYVGAKAGNQQDTTRDTSAPSEQYGLPLGSQNPAEAEAAAKSHTPPLAHFYDFSQADRSRILKVTAPMFLVTAAQTQLLLAEARFRGWINAGTAQEYFANGIRAHMEQLGTVDENSTVAEADITAYIDDNPLNAGTELEQINTEYWIASFLNGPEAFANFRRSDFPQLPPNPLAGVLTTEPFIRRLVYPSSELSVNTEKVGVAVKRMKEENGNDDGKPDDYLDTRVWWDRP